MKERILFVCHGNICRSPMAEYIMKHLAEQYNLNNRLIIASAATSCEEIGNDIYPPAKQMLSANAIPFSHHTARRITRNDYQYYDIIYIMDHANARNLRYVIGEDTDHKVLLLMQAAGLGTRDVEDPWYTGDFGKAYQDIYTACSVLIKNYLQ